MKVEEILLEMGTSLDPSETGIDARIWISSSEFQGKRLPIGHGRRIKVRNGPGPKDFASADIDTKEIIGDLDVNIKNQVIAYIRHNFLQLARIWEQGPGRERHLAKRLRKLPPTGW